MKAGDIIEVHEIRNFETDLWRPAAVISVDGERFDAELLKGDFGEPGVNRKWFPMHEKGRQWR